MKKQDTILISKINNEIAHINYINKILPIIEDLDNMIDVPYPYINDIISPFGYTIKENVPDAMIEQLINICLNGLIDNFLQQKNHLENMLVRYCDRADKQAGELYILYKLHRVINGLIMLLSHESYMDVCDMLLSTSIYNKVQHLFDDEEKEKIMNISSDIMMCEYLIHQYHKLYE